MTLRERLPDRVTVVEVGPRDGLQNEPGVVPTALKVAFIERLADCGLQVVETTSFVSPKRVPQLADAEEVLTRVKRVATSGLTLVKRGALVKAAIVPGVVP